MERDTKTMTAKHIIGAAKKRMQDELDNENWGRAADLESYIDGLRQMLVVFTGNDEDGRED